MYVLLLIITDRNKIEPKELALRNYQMELAEKAKEGTNCIIFAPTGSGKTHVALEIIRVCNMSLCTC